MRARYREREAVLDIAPNSFKFLSGPASWRSAAECRPPEEFEAGQTMRTGTRLRHWAQSLKRDIVALSLAARDARVPWYAKAAALAVAAYALSPIDLIPDFIPVLGYVDELIILPVAIALVIKMIPAPLMAEFREEAQRRAERPTSRAGALLIVAIWIAALALALWAFWPNPVP